MKYLKRLALVALAAVALIVVVSGSSASATVLCKTTSTPCGERWHSGTEITASLPSEFTATISETGGNVLTTCAEASLKYKTQSEGSLVETVSAALEGSSSFGGCTKQWYLLSLGGIEIHQIAGTDNGTVTAKDLRLTAEIMPVFQYTSCTYTAGEGIDLGTLRGGEPAELEVNATLSKQEGSFVCPSDVVWKSRYAITQPLAIYIESE